MRKNIVALCIIFSFIFCGSSFANDAFRLSDGLGVVSSKHSGETAAACLFIKTGYASEPAGKNGITDLLCNCVLSDNPVDSANPPSLRIKQMGGKVTAAAESDYTCFTLVSPAASFPAALRALSEMVSGIYFSDDTVRIEKAAITARNDFARDRAEGRMYYA
ncbi:MAG: insulinase family protein, partial [Nitrospirota bacterium]